MEENQAAPPTCSLLAHEGDALADVRMVGDDFVDDADRVIGIADLALAVGVQHEVIGKLKDAGLVTVDAGVGGAHIARPLTSITLLDVYQAIEGPDRQLFGFHDNPNPQCPVGRNIHTLLDGELDAAQHALETQLGQMTLARLNDRLDTLTEG